MNRSMVDRVAGTGDYLFMYFYESVWIGAGDGRKLRAPGSLVIWRPEDGHYYGHREYTWRHTWMHCDGLTIAKLLPRFRLPLNTVIPLADTTLMERYLFSIHEEITQFAKPDERIVTNFFENMLREIQRLTRGDARTPLMVPRELLELKSHIDSEFHRPLTLEGLAQRIHLSVPHLCSVFKRNFGSSVMAYVIAQRMRQAAYLLRDRNMRVGDVARAVGYEDLFYFSKLFKGRFGASPREFRRGR